MNNTWTPENIAAIITGLTALIGALGALWHSINTRAIANNTEARVEMHVTPDTPPATPTQSNN